MQVGDKVWYVPAECHAKDKLNDGSLAWDFSREEKGILTPLSPEEAITMLSFLARRKDKIKTMVATKPRVAWAAEVTKVHEDGKVDLDIYPHLPGVTLHYEKIQVDLTEKIPHSCHPAA
jgi:hypothetical protein